MNFRHLQSNRVRTTRIQFLSTLPFSFPSRSFLWPSFLWRCRATVRSPTARSSTDFLCPYCQIFNAEKRETVRWCWDQFHSSFKALLTTRWCSHKSSPRFCVSFKSLRRSASLLESSYLSCYKVDVKWTTNCPFLGLFFHRDWCHPMKTRNKLIIALTA